MKKIIFLCLTSALVYTQHPNIFISNLLEPNEPSILINPNNTNQIVAASNIFNMYTSTNAGLTWSYKNMNGSSTYGVWGDPSFAFDNSNNIYFFHLSNPISGGSWIDRIVCQKSTDFGVTWSNGTYTGLNGSKAQDKQWATFDRELNTMYLTWTQFDNYGSASSSDSSLILFSKSTDYGATWSSAVRLSKFAGNCIDSDSTTEGAVPAVGINNEVLVAWSMDNKIYFDKSTDMGNTWMENDMQIATQPGGWDYAIPGIYRANGLPITLCDTSQSSPHYGNIYVVWTDQRNGTNNTDVFMVKSTDVGVTWSSEIRINTDVGNTHQFFCWPTIDPSNGNLYVIYYDRKNYTDTRTDVTVAVSMDGGNSFVSSIISESPFIPNATVFFGDYNNISAINGVVRPIWTRLDGTGLSIYTAIVDTFQLHHPTANVKDELVEDLRAYPNPFDEKIYISFKLKKSDLVSLRIYNMQGSVVYECFENTPYAVGKHIYLLDENKFKVPKGVYFYELKIGNQIRRKTIIKN